MLLFRSEEHVDRWCTQWRMSRGAVLSLDQQWFVAREWYGSDRRAHDWRRKTVDEAEAVFAEAGLSSTFWALR